MSYEHLESFTLDFVQKGCTDTSAGNYNQDADVDDGTCIDMDLFLCAENTLLGIDLSECHHEHSKRALRLYTIFKMYNTALSEGNKVKSDMYKKELKKMCDAQYCESC